MNRLGLTLWMLLAVNAASAQTVWRCGVDGRSYSDSACPGGRVVAVADERSAADRNAGERVVARDRALAERLHEERLAAQREQWAAAHSGAGLGSLNAAPAPQAQVSPTKTPKKKPTKTKKPSKKTARQQRVPGPAAAGTSPSAVLSTRPLPG